MDKDKESMAMLQNKRQEFRFTQVVKAVNKERDLRERELSHESNQFKARLQKLVDKRKELKLDPLKTRELELLLGPGFRPKSRCRSPERKLSPIALPALRAADDSGNNLFVTIIHENVIDKAPAYRKDSSCEKGSVALDGHRNEKSAKHKDIVTGIMKDAGNENSDVVDITRNYSSQSHRARVRKISQYTRRELKLDCKEMGQPPALRKTNSELHVKLDNVQHWLSEMEIDPRPTLNKPITSHKRHSTSS